MKVPPREIRRVQEERARKVAPLDLAPIEARADAATRSDVLALIAEVRRLRAKYEAPHKPVTVAELEAILRDEGPTSC